MIFYDVNTERWFDEDIPAWYESMVTNIMGIYPTFQDRSDFYLWFKCECDMGCEKCMGIVEIKPCPFCGEQPEVDGLVGAQLDIYCPVCGCCMGFQKSDHLTKEEEATWDEHTYSYSDEAEKKVYDLAISIWNTRVRDNGKR